MISIFSNTYEFSLKIVSYLQGPIGLDGPKGETVNTVIKFLRKKHFQHLYLQGRPGDKGQKGDLGNPGIDVIQAVKV